MNFEQALENLKMRKKCRRYGWNGVGMHLEVQIPDLNSKMTHPYLFITIPECEEGIRKLPWQPTQADLFEEDWEVID